MPQQVAQAPGRPELGTDDVTASNPPFGALLTYYLQEAPATTHEARRAEEKKLREKGSDAPFPGYDRLFAESLESGPKVIVSIADATGRIVRRIDAPAKAGLHRINWDLRGPSPEPVNLDPPGFQPPWGDPPRGPLVAPGRYTVTLMMVSASGLRTLGTPQSFDVKPVNNLPAGTDVAAVAKFQQEVADLRRRAAGTAAEITRLQDELRHMRAALLATPKADPALFTRIDSANKALAELTRRLNGDPARQRLNESASPRSRTECPQR